MNIDRYTELLQAMLVLEYGKTSERAKQLIRDNPDIVIQGIWAGNQSLGGCAMALDTKDNYISTYSKCPQCGESPMWQHEDSGVLVFCHCGWMARSK